MGIVKQAATLANRDLDILMQKLEGFCQKFAQRLLWAFISVYILIFSGLSFLKYQSFSYYDWDLASDAIVLWNSLHGEFLYYPFLEQSILGAHLYLISIFILPIYALFQSPLTLLFLQSIFLGLGASPLYLLARCKLNATFALAVVVVYLLYPSLGFINLFESHFEIYEIFLLFFALYYFEKEKFKKFLIFALLALFCKENASLAVFGLGIYAGFRRRSQKWIWTPLLIAGGWFILSLKVIIPYFAKDAVFYQGGFMFSSYYKHLGSNLGEMVKTVFLHPQTTLNLAFEPRKLIYLCQLFLPIGFLGLFSPLSLVPAVLVFGQNLLSAVPTHASIRYQYVALLIPFIFLSLIQALNRILRWKLVFKLKGILLLALFGFVTSAGLYLEAPQFNLVGHIFEYWPKDEAREKERLIAAIPKNASVLATFQFLPKLANRIHLYSLHLIAVGYRMYTSIRYQPPENLEYALIDFNEPLLVSVFLPPPALKNIRTFLEADDWNVYQAYNDVVLFKKGYPDGHRLCEIIQHPVISHPLNFNLDQQIVFLGYDINDSMLQERLLHLIYYWQKISSQRRPLGFFIQFRDVRGKVKFQAEHVFGYRVYLGEEWRPGQIVKEHHYILVPKGFKATDYQLEFGPFIFEPEF